MTERLALTRAEAAEAIGVHPQTISKLVHEGRLKAVHVGARLIIPRSELERFLKTEAARTA